MAWPEPLGSDPYLGEGYPVHTLSLIKEKKVLQLLKLNRQKRGHTGSHRASRVQGQLGNTVKTFQNRNKRPLPQWGLATGQGEGTQAPRIP
jgi:hypothetical protein